MDMSELGDNADNSINMSKISAMEMSSNLQKVAELSDDIRLPSMSSKQIAEYEKMAREREALRRKRQ